MAYYLFLPRHLSPRPGFILLGVGSFDDEPLIVVGRPTSLEPGPLLASLACTQLQRRGLSHAFQGLS